MGCSDYTSYGDFLVNGQFFDAITCVYADTVGMAVAALFVFLTLEVGLYIYSDSVILPTVVGIIFAGSVATYMPPVFVGAAVAIILILLMVLAAIAYSRGNRVNV